MKYHRIFLGPKLVFKNFQITIAAAVIFSAMFATSAPARAASFYWDTTTTGLWSNASNWWTTPTGTTAVGPPGSIDDAIFDGTTVNGNVIVQLGADTSVKGLIFGNTGTTLLDSSTTTSRALTIGLDGITISAGAGAVTLGDLLDPMTVTLGSSETWTNNSSNLLSVVNNITNSTNTLTITGTGNTAIGGALGSGSGPLIKLGTGGLTLSGANKYTGTTTVLNGSLTLDFSGATAPATNILYNGVTVAGLTLGNSTLTLTGKASMTNSQTVGPLTIDNGSVAIVLNANATSNPLLLTLGSITRNNNSAIDFTLPSGTQSATNGIRTTTPGLLTTANLLGGWATVNGGSDLAATSASSGTVNIVAYTGYTSFVGAGSSLTTNYSLSGSGVITANEQMASLKITDTGAGQSLNLGASGVGLQFGAPSQNGTGLGLLYAGGASNSYTINGAAVLATGTTSGQELFLGVKSGATLTINAPIGAFHAIITKTGGGTLNLTTTNSQNNTSGIIDGGVVNDSGGGFAGLILTINGGTLKYTGTTPAGQSNDMTIGTGGATLDASGTGSGTLQYTSTGNLFYSGGAGPRTLTLTGSSTLNNQIRFYANDNPGGGALTLVKTGSGFWSYNRSSGNPEGYTGGAFINGGILNISGSSALGAGIITFGGGTLQYGNTADVSARIVNSASAISIDTLGNTVIYTSALASSNTGGLTKFGAGTLALQATNLFSGATAINAGTLSLTTANGRLAASTAITINNGAKLGFGDTNSAADRILDTATITVNGGSFDYVGQLSQTLSETVASLSVGPGLAETSIDPNSNSNPTLTFTNGWSRAAGHGVILLRGPNNWSGANPSLQYKSNVSEAGLLVGGGGAFNTSTQSIVPWAVGGLTLASQGSDFVTYDSSRNTFRPLNTAGNANEYATSITAGSSNANNVLINNGTTSITSATTINALNLASTGVIGTGTGTLNITSGAVILNPSATSTVISGATVAFGGAEGIITNVTTSANTSTISSAITGTNGVTFTGTQGGITKLTAVNTYTGGTTLNAGALGGTLALGANGAVPSSGGLTINPGATFSRGTFTDTIGSLTMTGGTISASGTAGVLTLAGDVTAVSSLATAASITGGMLALADTALATRTFSIGSAGLNETSDLTIADAIANGVGAAALQKTGSGILTLSSAANTFSGGVVIGAGTLKQGIASAIPGSNQMTITSPGVFDLGGLSAQVAGLSGSGTVTQSLTGAATLTSAFPSGAQSFSGVIQNGGGTTALTIAGGAVQVLSGANTYTGATTISGSTLSLDFSAAGAPAFNIINSIAPSSALVANGGLLNLIGKASTTNSQQFNGITLTSGATSIALSANATSNPLSLSLGAITRAAGGGTVDFTQPTGTISATNGITTTTANNASGILGGYATVGGTNWATNNGTNIVALATYTDINALGSTITSAAASNVRINAAGSGGNIALSVSPTGIGSLLQNSTTAATIDTAGKTLQIAAGGGILLASGAGGLTIGAAADSGTLTTGAPGGELILNNNSANPLTINATITNGNPTSLTKTGPGQVTLTGTNTFTGTTTLSGGVLSVGSVSNGGTASNWGAGSNNLVFDGGTLQYTGSSLASITAGRDFSINPGKIAVFDIVNAGTAFNTKGFVATATTGGLMKVGLGKLGLTNGTVPNYSGPTIVSAGTLQIIANYSFTAKSPMIINGGTLDYANSANNNGLDLLNVIFTGGGFTRSAGTADINFHTNNSLGVFTAAGTPTFSANGLRMADSGIYIFDVIDGSLTPGNFNGSAGGNQVLTKGSTGTLVLNGVNSSLGGVSSAVDAGTLTLDFTNNNNVKLGTNQLKMNGGTLRIVGNASAGSPQTMNNMSLSGGSIVNNASGSSSITLASSFITRNAGSSIDFQQGGAGTINLVTSNNSANILGGFATFNGADWATKVTSSLVNPLSALASYATLTNSINGSQTNTNYSLGSGLALNASGLQANSLKINDSGVSDSLTLGSANLTFSGASGGLLYTGGGMYTVSGTGVIGGGPTSEFIANVNFGSTLVISAPVVGSATSGSFTKAGGGVLALSASNTYTGITYVDGGVLRLDSATALPGGIGATGGASNLAIQGGVVGLANGDFSRNLGVGGAQLQFAGNGGFAAYGADRVVNLGGASAPLIWGGANFIQPGFVLTLGAASADHKVDFQNPTDLAGYMRNIQVDRGTGPVDAQLSGIISSTTGPTNAITAGVYGGIDKVGAGVLSITGANTYAGGTILSAGTLRVGNAAGSATGSGIVTLNAGTLASATTGGSIAGGVVAGLGAHAISPGGDGGIGSLGVGGLSLNGNSTLRFDITSTSMLDQINDAGSLSVTGAASIAAPVGLNGGTYKLIGFGSTALTTGANPAGFALTAIGGGAAPGGYSLNLTPNELDLVVVSSSPGAIAIAPAAGNPTAVHVGQPATIGVNVGNTAAAGSMGLNYNLTGAFTAGPFTRAAGDADAASGNLNTGSYAASASGLNNLSVTATDANGATGSPATANFSVTAYNLAAAAPTQTVSVAAHVGTAKTIGITLANTAPADATYSETLSTNGFTTDSGYSATGSISNLAAGASDSSSLNVGVNSSAMAGHNTGHATLALNSNAVNGSGLGTTSVSPQIIAISADVFTGNANWNGGAAGAWAIDSNWIDAASSATAGAPGLSGAVSIGDQAHFQTTAGNVAVDLVNAQPHIAALSFAAGAGAYTISASGSGKLLLDNGASAATVAVGGAHTIAAPVTLVSDITVTTSNTGDSLTLSGPQDFGGKNIAVGGSGALRLAAAVSPSNVAGVTVTVGGAATLELAGAASALSSGPLPVDRAQVQNDSTAGGLLVSGMHQVVGGLDGAGSTTVAAGADLTVNHINQTSLTIGAGATMTLAASNADGSPMSLPTSSPSSLVLAGSLSQSISFASGLINPARLSTTSQSAAASGNVAISNSSLSGAGLASSVAPVPEPSGIVLVTLGSLIFMGFRRATRAARCMA